MRQSWLGSMSLVHWSEWFYTKSFTVMQMCVLFSVLFHLKPVKVCSTTPFLLAFLCASTTLTYCDAVKAVTSTGILLNTWISSKLCWASWQISVLPLFINSDKLCVQVCTLFKDGTTFIYASVAQLRRLIFTLPRLLTAASLWRCFQKYLWILAHLGSI